MTSKWSCEVPIKAGNCWSKQSWITAWLLEVFLVRIFKKTAAVPDVKGHPAHFKQEHLLTLSISASEGWRQDFTYLNKLTAQPCLSDCIRDAPKAPTAQTWLSWRHKEVGYSTIVAVMAAVTATQDRPHMSVRGLHTTLHVYFSFLTYKELYLYDHITLGSKISAHSVYTVWLQWQLQSHGWWAKKWRRGGASLCGDLQVGWCHGSGPLAR